MSCNTGFTGKNMTSRCTDVNTWSKNAATCTSKFVHSIWFKPLRVVRRLTRHSEITCTKTSLHLTQNVNVTYDKQRYDFHKEVAVSCNDGLSGRTVTRRCTDVNIWSKITPNCKSKIFRTVLILILWHDTHTNYCKIQNNKLPRWYMLFWSYINS